MSNRTMTLGMSADIKNIQIDPEEPNYLNITIIENEWQLSNITMPLHLAYVISEQITKLLMDKHINNFNNSTQAPDPILFPVEPAPEEDGPIGPPGTSFLDQPPQV